MGGLIPNVYERIRDFQLGILPPATDSVFLKIGVASDGPVNEVVSVTEPDDAVTLFAGGPLVESAAYHLVTSGSTLLLVRANASIAGTLGDVKPVKAPGSTGTLTLSGSPLDAYEIVVQVQRDGGRGAAAFAFSLDGGDVFSNLTSVPVNGVYPLPGTGVTLNFDANTFKTGDLFAASTTAPAMSLADVNDAITAAFNDGREFSIAHIVGAGGPSLYAALAVRATEAQMSRHRFTRWIMEARDYSAADGANVSPSDSAARAAELRRAAWQSALGDEYANSASLRVGVVAGMCELYSALNGRIMRRAFAWPYVARLAAIPVQVHPGSVEYGPLPGVVSVTHDEESHPGLDLLGFTTARKIIGLKGFYVTRGRLMAPTGSDYQFISEARVMDKASKIARISALTFLNRDVFVAEDGTLSEVEAAAMGRYISAGLVAGLINEGNATDAYAVVKRAANVLATRAAEVRVCIVPKGYLENITLDLGFFNPALASVGA